MCGRMERQSCSSACKGKYFPLDGALALRFTLTYAVALALAFALSLAQVLAMPSLLISLLHLPMGLRPCPWVQALPCPRQKWSGP